MSDTVNGSAGIPRKGREAEYATEMWLDDPSAFWLHPEGPLSEATPDEWRAKQPKPSAPDPLMQSLAGLGAIRCGGYAAMLQNAANPYLQNAPPGVYDLGDLLNAAPGSLLRYTPFGR